MSTHNQCFRAKIRKKMYTPVHPSFTIQKWGVRGYSLHGLVFVMLINWVSPLSILWESGIIVHFYYIL